MICGGSASNEHLGSAVARRFEVCGERTVSNIDLHPWSRALQYRVGLTVE
jgi:hypothetical protein